MSGPLRVVLIGAGSMAELAFRGTQSADTHASVVGIISRRDLPAWAAGTPRVRSTEELTLVNPDIVVEAASQDAVREWLVPTLAIVPKIVLSSTGALVDDRFRMSALEAASSAQSAIAISPGAIAGLDGLSAARCLGLDHVRHRITKSSQGWEMSASDPRILFRGTARAAATEFPKNANSVAATAFAGIGLDLTKVELFVDPEATENRHDIEAQGAFGRLQVSVANRPIDGRPRSSTLAALALLRVIRNETSGIVL